MQWLYIFLVIFCAIFGAAKLLSIFYGFSIDRITKYYDKHNITDKSSQRKRCGKK